MVKLIIGLKGSGKTKMLIEMVNSTVDKTDGSVVCIEKGTKLIHEIKYQARLVDTDEYSIDDAKTLFGFLSGIVASDHDANDIFVDSALKICNNDLDSFVWLIERLEKLSDIHSVCFTITSSILFENLPEKLKGIVINQ